MKDSAIKRNALLGLMCVSTQKIYQTSGCDERFDARLELVNQIGHS